MLKGNSSTINIASLLNKPKFYFNIKANYSASHVKMPKSFGQIIEELLVLINNKRTQYMYLLLNAEKICKTPPWIVHPIKMNINLLYQI